MPEDGYWQRRLPGQAMSVTFAASCGKVCVLGFNRQWTIELDDRQAFVFAGVASFADVSLVNQNLLRLWLEKLAGVYKLRGLGSLDFIMADDCCLCWKLTRAFPPALSYTANRFFRCILTHV